MSADDAGPKSFASLYLTRKKGRAGKTVDRMSGWGVQEDLFGAKDSREIVAAATIETASCEENAPSALPSAELASQSRRVWTVRELVGEVRLQVERVHFSVWVEGEVSNCRPAGSGHFYFTLKDGEAQLPVVMFRRQAQLLAAKPKDGDAVEVRGRVSVYESRGQLQLIAETVEMRGSGALELAFKRLKARLLAEGMFAEERKRVLPEFPKCVGVITSPQGAVVRDIANVVRRRHACLNLLVYPAAMQGARCAAEVVAGIRWFNRNPDKVDLIMMARGGGSIEDLAGFNDEALARAIVASELPVVSAIGHETDFTIADFVADLRAPTPSAGAELVTAAQHRIEERVEELAARVRRAGRYQTMLARQRYTQLAAEGALVRLRDAVSRREQRIDELGMRLENAARRRLRLAAGRLTGYEERRRMGDPAARLAAARRRLEGAALRVERLRSTLVTREGARLAAVRRRLLAIRVVEIRAGRLARTAAQLEALSPLAVLGRGYALVYTESGARRLVRDAAEIVVGERIRVRLGMGSLVSRVEEIG